MRRLMVLVALVAAMAAPAQAGAAPLRCDSGAGRTATKRAMMLLAKGHSREAAYIGLRCVRNGGWLPDYVVLSWWIPPNLALMQNAGYCEVRRRHRPLTARLSRKVAVATARRMRSGLYEVVRCLEVPMWMTEPGEDEPA